MDEKNKKIKMDDGVAVLHSLRKGIWLFVDLWEAQPCLRDPE